MRGLATARFQRIIGRLQHILRGGAAHDQKTSRINPEGMKPRWIQSAIFARCAFLLDPDDRSSVLCSPQGQRQCKAGRRHMRAGIFRKDLMQRIACKAVRKGCIRIGKSEREAARATEARFCFAGKTALRIVVFDGCNHAPQRRDVDAAHV